MGAGPYLLLLSGMDGHAAFDQVVAAGIDDFLFKPLDPLALRARLRVAERIMRLEHGGTERTTQPPVNSRTDNGPLA